MPVRKAWLPREGFTAEVLGPILKTTVLNPALTLPLVLLARLTKRGSDLSILHPKTYNRIKLLLALGLLRWANGYLSRGALDNWKSDRYVWSQEVVLVTGGAGGIGGGVVKLLAERGIKVVVLDVIPMTFSTPANVHYFHCDITNSSAISAVATQIRKTVGNPTVLFLNAGVLRGKSILEATERDVRTTFDVNTISHYLLAREFVPALVARDHGMIVTVASLASYVTVPKMVDYAASKAAALAFHEGLTAELATLYAAPKVRTVVINPGYTKTVLAQGYHNDSAFLMPTMEVDTVAEAITAAILKGRSGQVVIPGFANVASLLKGLPHWLQRRVRDNGVTIMQRFQGRQAVDGEKEYGVKKEDVSASTVLVEPEQK